MAIHSNIFSVQSIYLSYSVFVCSVYLLKFSEPFHLFEGMGCSGFGVSKHCLNSGLSFKYENLALVMVKYREKLIVENDVSAAKDGIKSDLENLALWQDKSGKIMAI